jgi:Lycopene cyclase
MIPDRYVWLAWAGSFLVPWLVPFGLFPRHRIVMWRASVMAVPFALSEPLFLGRYWAPPTLFNLAGTAHFDLESFVFCFAIGGVAAVAFDVVTGRPPRFRLKTVRDMRRQPLLAVAIAAPLPAFGAVLLLTGEPIWAGAAGFAAGIAARLVCRPDLAAKSIGGGLLFAAYYLASLAVLDRLVAPGYVDRVWNATGPAGVRLLGLPRTEWVFAVAFGVYWSGLYEQIDWTFAVPEPRTAGG